MKQAKDWSNFMVSCSAISTILSLPKGCANLTQKQKVAYDKLLGKEKLGELSDYERLSLDKMRQKVEFYKDPPLSEGAKRYLISRYAWEKYNKGTIPTGTAKPFTEKGLTLESRAKKIISQRHKIKYQEPDTIINNGYLFGIADLVSYEKSRVVDLKVSWGIHTFLPNIITELSSRYWFQMQGYMELYDVSKAYVCFVLLNTPEHLVDMEKKKYTDKWLLGEITEEKYEDEMEKLSMCYDYSAIPQKEKVITFEVKRDFDAIKTIYNKIDKCRRFLQDFDTIHTNNKKILTLSENYIHEQSDNEEGDT